MIKSHEPCWQILREARFLPRWLLPDFRVWNTSGVKSCFTQQIFTIGLYRTYPRLDANLIFHADGFEIGNFEKKTTNPPIGYTHDFPC